MKFKCYGRAKRSVFLNKFLLSVAARGLFVLAAEYNKNTIETTNVEGIQYMEKEEIQETTYGGAERLQMFTGKAVDRVELLSPETFVLGAAISVGASLLLRAIGRQHDAQFVGQWAPTLLILGLYTKRGYESRTISERAESSVKKALH